ncbi:HD-GYP domain-containing protein [Methylomicrobium lacus]|uniref:HD-GYP domain-containing protein n=1 Tax=Methylomicrobium lacus TaxID=136992 RepID=UPI00045E7CD4|nr:HD-GYP domain-containing protein [Methylomicrobium lacus]
MFDDDDNIFLDTQSSLLKIHANDLRVGMYVSKLDRPWLETPFLFQGFELKNQADIDAVKQHCDYVFIDVFKQNNLIRESPGTPYSKGWLESRTPPKKSASFEQEIERAGTTYRKTSHLIKSFMDEVQLGNSINVQIAEKFVAECVNSILQSPDALLWMTQLKNQDLYTSQHSMNVCILAIALGRHLNLSVHELNHLGLCGMMHDMGKMRVPLAILNKPGKLTPAERNIMQSHAELGWKLLMSSSDMYAGAIDVAYSHHERLDGAGYPRKLNSEQITPYTRMVAIVDMYDAMTSDRIYQKGRNHLDAINTMLKAGDSHLDSALTYKFIQCLGIYPPGSVVEMNNGEVAIVIEVNPKLKIRPKIILLLNENKQPRSPRIIDLAKLDLDASARPYTIKQIVRPETYGIDLNRLYQMGLIQHAVAAV